MFVCVIVFVIMCVCLSVCVCLCVRVCFTVCLRLFVCLCVLVYVFEGMFECTHTQTPTDPQTYIPIHTNTHKQRKKLADEKSLVTKSRGDEKSW